MRLKSNRNRPVHLGSFKLEDLPRQEIADLSKVGPCRPLAFDAEDPLSLAMFKAFGDACREHAAGKKV